MGTLDAVIFTQDEGMCTGSVLHFRSQLKECNSNRYTDTEECFAMPYLILAIGGNGSIADKNFSTYYSDIAPGKHVPCCVLMHPEPIVADDMCTGTYH